MNLDVRDHDKHHHVGDSATRPIRPRCGALAALVLLAGMSPQRRPALPAHRIAAHSGASNCGFQVEAASNPASPFWTFRDRFAGEPRVMPGTCVGGSQPKMNKPKAMRGSRSARQKPTRFYFGLPGGS